MMLVLVVFLLSSTTTIIKNDYYLNVHSYWVMLGETSFLGVFFRYELSPYRVYQRAVAPPFSHIFAMCCAAIGGVLTFFGILSRPVAKIVETAFPALKEGNDIIEPQVVEKATAKSTLHRRKVESDFTTNVPTFGTPTTPVAPQSTNFGAVSAEKSEQLPLLHENAKAE